MTNDTDGRFILLKAIADKKDEPFRPREIVLETGLSRQNVNNHLKRMVENGILEHYSNQYILTDLNKLIDVYAAPTSSVRYTLSPTKLYDKGRLSLLIQTITYTTIARELKFEGADKLKETLNQEITDTIAMLKNAKHKLNTGSMTTFAASRKLHKELDTFEKDYIESLEALNLTFNRRKLQEQISIANDHYENEEIE